MSADSRPIKSILFVCNQNAVRSPMAKALVDRLSKRKIFAESAGIIAGSLDPFTVAVMAESGVDIQNHQPKALEAIDLSLFDLIVALTSESRARLQKKKIDAPLFWATPDPGESEGNRDRVMDSYRLVKDHLEVRIADLLKGTI